MITHQMTNQDKNLCHSNNDGNDNSHTNTKTEIIDSSVKFSDEAINLVPLKIKARVNINDQENFSNSSEKTDVPAQEKRERKSKKEVNKENAHKKKQKNKNKLKGKDKHKDKTVKENQNKQTNSKNPQKVKESGLKLLKESPEQKGQTKEKEENNIQFPDFNSTQDNLKQTNTFLEESFANEIEKIEEELHNQRKEIIELKTESQKSDNSEKDKSTDDDHANKNSVGLIPLKDDPKFKEDPEISLIQKDLKEITKLVVKNGIADKYKFVEIQHDDVIDFKSEQAINFFKNMNLILTEDAIKRLNLLYFCIKHGFHILIPGPTGTGKTYLSEAICNYLGKNMIKFNCSENTKFPNLKFTCQGDKNKFAGIKYIKGPLLKALTSKNTAFLMDEANLAPIETLQALEAIIDSGYMVYEEKGKLMKVEVPKDFCCILTLNPSKGQFSGTRQELPESFVNKFISIEFPAMSKDELYSIAEGASLAFGVDKKVDDNKKFIDDFISFHMEWSKNEKIQDDIACLVIRDILAVLHIIVEGEDPTETIMNIYGARYTEEIKKEMINTLFKYKSFKKFNKNYENLKNDFPKDCFLNKNTLELISTCVFSLKHGRHPIIAGNNGIGKKLLACKLGDYFNTHIAEKNDKSNEHSLNQNFVEDESLYIVYCTKSTKVEDLMGKSKVSNNKEEDLIQWQDGPLIKAVREGKPLILIGIHELPSSVLEYMNDLLDRKYDGKQRHLNNPNNPNEPEIPINKNFRLICTTSLADINKLSPAFATRMDIKILNDQLEGISDENLENLIKICLNNVKTELITYDEDIKNKIKILKGENTLELSKINESHISKSDEKNQQADKNQKEDQKSRSNSHDSKNSNSSKKSNNSNVSKNSNTSIKSKDSNKSQDSKKSKDSNKSQDSKKSKDSNKSQDSKKSKDSNKSQDSKKSKDSNKSQDSKKSKDSNKSQDSKKSKDSNKSQDSKKSKDSNKSNNSENSSKKSDKSNNSKKSKDLNSSKKSNENDIEVENEQNDDESGSENFSNSRNNSEDEDSLDNSIDQSEKNENNDNEEYLKFLEERPKFNYEKINNLTQNKTLIDEIKNYYNLYNKDNEDHMNMTCISKFIRSTILLLFKINYEEFTNDFRVIIKLVYDLLFSDQSSIIIDKNIKDYILQKILIEDPINKYFFHNIPKIENYMISLYLYCAMNIHVYVFGPPGVGKTAGAECLARIRTKIEKLEGSYKKYAFNSSTKPSDIYGAETLVDGQIKLVDGPLTEASLKGQTFIADEMNLSSNSTMLSLIPIFNTIHNRPIYFPGLQTPIKINPNFWFGAFQNYEGTAGRNATPHELTLKLNRIDYPTVEINDIKNICLNIKNYIYKDKDIQVPNISEDQVLQLADFMIKLNKKREDGNLSAAEAWSIRNLENIINRMAEQQKCNEQITYKYKQYDNCELYHNVLFYVLSYIDHESVDEAFDPIFDIIKNCFQLDEEKIKDLKDAYRCKPELSYDNEKKMYVLRKNNSKIIFENGQIKNNINFLNKTSSLLNTLFEALLCADTEPILFIGPTGYKTYLVKLLEPKIKIITLNEESSIEALLGSTGFFTKVEVKVFYLGLICDICLPTQKLTLIQNLRDDKLDENTLRKDCKKFFTKDNALCGKRIVFKKVVKKNLDKLFEKKNENIDDDNILNSIKLEFKPGLFTCNILGGVSLDLKNFDKIPTTTLERFNELFTGMKTLTLNEDKFCTITTQQNKLLCNTVDFIRFFATSTTKNFSEAVLSRWTVINTKGYEFDELEEVLKICSGELNLNTVTVSDIKYLIEVARFFKNTTKQIVSNKLLINTIELLHEMNKNLDDVENKENLYFINRQFIYYVSFKSIIESNKDDPNLAEKEITNQLYQYLFKSNKERQIEIEVPYGKSPFSFVYKGNVNGIKSCITNAFIFCLKQELVKFEPAFTTKFVELLNIIHLGISLNVTVILEGQIGQGKQTAIEYLADILGYKLLIIQLSSSNKEEDLLGKVIVDKDKETNATIIKVNETDLMQILRNKTDEKYLIVFNDLQNASDAVKEKISNICDRHQRHVLLPDGNTIDKPPLNIICVINTENNSDIRNKLPSPLLYSTIYHKIGEFSEKDIDNTTNKIFKKYFEKDYMNEARDFLEKYRKVNKILNDSKSRQLLSFNDINNYAKLRSKTKNSLDVQIIDNMVFYYRTQEEDIMSKIQNELSLKGFDFIPIFEYNPCHTELNVKINKNQKYPLILKVINKDKIKVNEIQSKLSTLTNHQKQCILFLACAWLTKSKIIIKGDTASGKTHCATIFAEMMGADLLTYQMNQDVTTSIFIGQSILEEDLNKEEIKTIKSYLSEVDHIKISSKSNASQLLPQDPKTWTPSIFNTLFRMIDVYVKISKNDENNKLLKLAKSKINCIISPQGRFKDAESQTTKGLVSGSWFLYDDIQFSSPDLLSIMTPLCSDKPKLNLFNAKDSPKYDSEINENTMKNVKLIHKNFNLIMTFNPKYCKNSQGLDPILENKCLSFNLPPIDNDYETSAQLLYGSLINSGISYDISYQLAGKLAKIHMMAKSKSLENKEFFEGDAIFTARTINRLVKYISAKVKENSSKISSIIKVGIDKLYARPYIEKGYDNDNNKSKLQIYREKIVECFSSEVDKFATTDSDNIFKDNLAILNQLRDIQIAVTESKLKEFKFAEFVSNVMNIKLGSTEFILSHIDSTLSFINSSKPKLASEHINNYYQISIIGKFLNNIKKYGENIQEIYNEKKLSDPELMQIKELQWPILRLELLRDLLNDNQNFPQILKREFSNETTEESDYYGENQISNKIIKLISEIVVKKDKNSFINLIKIINENMDEASKIIEYIEFLMPYYKFRKTNLDEISVWLPLILKLIKLKQTFKIKFNDDIEYKFSGSNDHKDKFNSLSLYFTSDKLTLSSNSKYDIKIKDKHFKYTIEKDKKGKDIPRFYYFVDKILDKELKEKTVKEIEEHSKKKNSLSHSYRYKYFKVSNLFEINKFGSIGKFWMIIYHMNDKTVQTLYKLLTEFEQKIFNLCLKFFNDNKPNTDKYVSFTSSLKFMNENLFAINLEADNEFINEKIKEFEKTKTDKNKKDLETFMNNSLYPEKHNFERINLFTSEIERDEIVKIYSEGIRNIEDLLTDYKIDRELKELKEKLNQLKININKIDSKNDRKIDNYKTTLINQIKFCFENGEITKEKYECISYNYQHLKMICENEINKEDNLTKVRWPLANEVNNLEKSKRAKFIEFLVWYSKIKNIINNIHKNNKNKDQRFSYVLELGNYEEMKYAFDLILSTDELTENEFNMVYSILNSHYIMKMVENRLEEYLYNPTFEINKILEDNLILNPPKTKMNINDYFYIYKLLKEVDNTFIISMPQFTCKDIVSLYIQFGTKNNKSVDYEPHQGPIVKQIQYKNMLQVILERKSQILDDNFGKKSAVESAKEIIYTLSQNSFGIKDSFDEFTNDIENKISSLKDKDKNKQKNFINIFKMTLDISKKIDEINNIENIKLSFDDTLFLEDNDWYKEINFTSNYPHLTYSLIKYENLYDDLNNLYLSISLNKDGNEIPFWLILLRLLCNINNINVDYFQENNEFSKKFSYEESKYLQSKISNLISIKKDINYQWLNLSLKQISNNLIHSKYARHIYDFIYYQIQSLPKLKEQLMNIIKYELMEFNKNIFDRQFDDTLIDIYDYQLMDKNEPLIQLIYEPKNYYIIKIKKKYDDIINDFINSEEYKKLNNFYLPEIIPDQNANNNGSKPFKTFYDSLKKEITETLNSIKDDYQKELEDGIRKSINSKINDIISNINNRNNDLQNLENLTDISLETYNKEIKKFVKNHEKKDITNDLNKYSTKVRDNSYKYAFVLIKAISNDFYKPIGQKYYSVKLIINSDKLVDEDKIINIDEKEMEFRKYIPIPSDFKKEDKKELIKISVDGVNLLTQPKTQSKFFVNYKYKNSFRNDKALEYLKTIFWDININEFNFYDKNSINKDIVENNIRNETQSSQRCKTICFGVNDSINEEKEKLYDNLEKFIEKNKNLAKIIDDISKNKKIDCIKTKNEIQNCRNSIKSISNLLKCKCSDDTQFPKITEKLEDINNYFKQLSSLFSSFKTYIDNNVYDYIDSYQQNESQLNSMLKSIKIISPTSSFNLKPNLHSLNIDCNSLSSLMIYEEKGKISCSQNDIILNFGNYIPSLIKGDFSVYILSVINTKLYTSIFFDLDPETGQPETKYNNLVIIKNEVESNELFSIITRLPKKTEENDEEFDICFKLKIGNNNLSELELPCNFKFILSSLKIAIKCENYKLIIKDNELTVCTSLLEENESIKFNIKYLNENLKLPFKVSYKANNENDAKEPTLSIDDKSFTIKFAREYDNISMNETNFSLKKFDALVYIYFTNDIFIPINIKANILPFRFKITAFDYNRPEKPAEDILKVYYGENQVNIEQKLFFKISVPDNNKKYNGSINVKIEDFYNNLTILENSLNDNFEILKKIKFNLVYKINRIASNDLNIKISVCINEFTRDFKVIFIKAPPIIDRFGKIDFKIYPECIPLFYYDYDNKNQKFNLIQVNNTNINKNPFATIFVTPFYINELELLQRKDVRIKFSFKKNNTFYKLSKNGEIIKEKANESRIDMEQEYPYYYRNQFKIKINSLPLIGECDGIWYPCYNEFDFNPDNQKLYQYDKTNKYYARKNLEIFENDYISQNNLQIVNYYNTNFHAIGNYLVRDENFNNIEEILKSLPEELANDIYDQINLVSAEDEQIENYLQSGSWFFNINKDKNIIKGTIFYQLKENKEILKNNVIFALSKLFQEQYVKLKKENFSMFIFGNDSERFNRKVNEMRENYFRKGKDPEIIDKMSDTSDQLCITNRFINQNKKSNQKYLQKNEPNSREIIKFVHYNNISSYSDYTKDESEDPNASISLSNISNYNPSNMMISSDIILPTLDRPENESDLTLNKLINFYSDAIKITRILPIFIRDAIKNNDESKIIQAEERLQLLINTYHAFKSKNNKMIKDVSFLQNYVNDFINSFEIMISKFKKAGFNTVKLGLEHIKKEEDSNEILKIPEFETMDEKNNFWNIYRKNDFNEINRPHYDNLIYNKILEENKDLLNNKDYDAGDYNNKINVMKKMPNTVPQINTNSDNNLKPNVPEDETNYEMKEITFKNEKVSDFDLTNDNQENELNDNQNQAKEAFDELSFVKIVTDETPQRKGSEIENDDEKKQEDNNTPIMKLNSNAMSKMVINPTLLGKNNMMFNEKDGIEKSILKISKMDDSEIFSCDYKKMDNYIPKEVESVKEGTFSIEDMIAASTYITKVFIKMASENDIPFLNEGVAILIDCSGYINKENKLYNMFLICGLTEGINSIGIPYSVTLISDENFKKIIKTYDCPHNKYELQKIYECYMVSRYRTNLAKSVKFAIDNLKFDAKISTNDGKILSNTAYLFFTDGMDENLFFGKKFKDYLFNDIHTSFGFVFIKSSLLTDEHLKILNKLWDDFENNIKGCTSPTQIVKIKNQIDPNQISEIVNMFVNILARDISEQSYQLNNYPIEKPIFEFPSNNKELEEESLSFIKESLGFDYSIIPDIYYSTSQICYKKQKADKLDMKIYNNKIGNIIECKVNNSIQSEFNKLSSNYLIPKNKINISLLDQIFCPNKPSSMVLSTTGTEIDIPAFIKYLLENSPNPMIYLEKKGGYTKHYTVSIVIDSSYSCLSKISFAHTIQTIRSLISNIVAINIPSVDIIVATSTNPIVISSDKPSTQLQGKNSILNSLFKILSQPCLKANLASALKTAKDLQKVESKDTTKYMFVLTDGFYQQNEVEIIRDKIFECMQTSMLIGIGIGYYPLKIKKLFIQNIFVPNPIKLLNGIAVSTAKSNEKYTATMPYLPLIKIKEDIFINIIENLANKGDNNVNDKLIKELENVPIEMDAFSDFYNAEKEQYDESGNMINPTGKNTSMYTEGLLEGHEILFVCLYNADMNPNEDPVTNFKYLFEKSPSSYYCFKQCADYYKAKIKLVLNYEDAINELIKPWEKDPAKCKYYATFIVNGPPYPMLPTIDINGNKLTNEANPYLLGQFMEVIDLYNRNGGSLIFLTESDPLFYQANLFLENLELYDKNHKNKVKVTLQLEGEHQGDQTLKGDPSGQLANKGLFNKSAQSFKNLTRSSLSHNLFSYYEGYTIDYADYNKVLNSPFYPFARDSDGGVAGFFYPADQERGDIVFNCSYTSLYMTKKENDGTYKYYENIIAWTARPEVHIKYDGCMMKDYRPKKVNYTIDYNKKWTKFLEMPKKEITEEDLKKMKTLFCIDASGSVGGVVLYHNIARRIFDKFYKSGNVIYLWGSSTRQINDSEFRSWNNNRDDGLGGTSSELIADIINAERYNNIEHLIIITDGCVDTGSIDRSDQKMKQYNIHFKYVSTYIIGSGGDRTVGAPYCRGDPNITYLYTSEYQQPEKLASLSQEEISLLNNLTSINNYSSFINKYDKISNVVEAKMFGREADSDLLSKLNTLERNVKSSSMSSEELSNFTAKFNLLRSMANGGLRNCRLNFGAKMIK